MRSLLRYKYFLKLQIKEVYWDLFLKEGGEAVMQKYLPLLGERKTSYRDRSQSQEKPERTFLSHVFLTTFPQFRALASTLLSCHLFPICLS